MAYLGEKLSSRIPFTVDPPHFWRCMKIQHLSLIDTEFSTVGAVFAAAGEIVPRELRMGNTIPPSSRSTFIVDKKERVILGKGVLCRQTLRLEEWEVMSENLETKYRGKARPLHEMMQTTLVNG